MIDSVRKSVSHQSSSEGSELVASECPTCKMLHWHKTRSQERRICPFCDNAQPDYITRIVPERVQVREALPPSGDIDGHCPFVLEFFMVQGNGFRCMAYRNGEGKWRGAFDGEELPGAVRVLG